MSNKEYWDLLDADRIPTGEVFCRSDTIQPGQLHTVVHVCIFNENNEMLIQHRSESKDNWPGRWDVSAGGSALTGETSRRAAQRTRLWQRGCHEGGFDCCHRHGTGSDSSAERIFCSRSIRGADHFRRQHHGAGADWPKP